MAIWEMYSFGQLRQNNPDVFQPKEKPWVKIDNSSTDKIIETIQKCPSAI